MRQRGIVLGETGAAEWIIREKSRPLSVYSPPDWVKCCAFLQLSPLITP